MDYSVLYGLRNPAFTDDYAQTMIDRQFPTSIDPSNGLVNTINTKINPGQPESDLFQNKKQKEYSMIKKVLTGLATLGAILIGIKLGPKYIKSVFNKALNLGKTAISKVSSSTINIFKNIKNKISP